MNKTKIEWCDYTWNPVVGCKHKCSYCYAKRINDRFKYISDWSEPQFFKDRLIHPSKIKKPSTIFVGSMCDLFGEWVPREWIHAILDIAKELPQHKFMFLTKNPVKYAGFLYAENIWLGATVENKKFKSRIEDMQYIAKHKVAKTFLSIEPILGDFNEVDFSGIDQIIVGAMTGQRAIRPKPEWIDSIKHPNIFYKDNIKAYLTDINKLKQKA